ncbi:MAG: arcadin 1 [Thaumarchaeota archaeon]|nr:arcadin 1 [Candidatus Calditenuaceae archaeon]MDW8042826.1 arcadin 1 [Nitrososphaerota archaeon]
MRVRVRVFRVSSYSDPDTGRPGKVIELVEVRPAPSTRGVYAAEEVVVAQQIFQSLLTQLQWMGLMPVQRDRVIPKMVLYLTEEEYERLGVRFEVNDEYELVMEEGKLAFQRPP